MKCAADYLDEMKEALSIASDYALAKKMGWSRARVSQYRTGLHHFDEAGALQVAALLDLDPAAVLLDALESRAHSPAARAAFGSIRERITAPGSALCEVRRHGRRWSDRLPAARFVPPAFMLAAALA